MSVLEVKNVSIRYITGDFKDIGLKEYVMKRLKGEYHITEFWADQDISFTLKKGEMLGIIGTNGAGKSTLLKAVSGIMEPTGGYVKRQGSIAALLELASGFDGDLTVRENAYLRGAMLGYTREFMNEKYDEIIDFAELRDFQDRPFRQLSSGMKSRLAFSIASLVQPDLLILDEVLSVGDGAFRKKSETKMKEIIAGGTATILVSHSIQQVRALCTKVLWLDHGRQIALSDDVGGICNLYQKFLNKEISLEETKKLAFAEGGPPASDTRAEPSHTAISRSKPLTVSKGRETEHPKTEPAKTDIWQEENTMEQEQGELALPKRENLWRRAPENFRLAFLSACFFCVITHIYVFTNLILNHDSVWRVYYNSNGLANGRWSQELVSNISTKFQMPVVIGFISVFMLALTAGLTVRILGISRKTNVVLTSAFLVTIPSVACIFSYMYTADVYFISLFLNTLAVFLLKEYKWGWIPALALCAFACGIYQAFICYAIGLLLIDCILALFSETPVVEILKKGAKYIGTVLGSLLLYYAILKFLLMVKGVELSSYQGISSMNLLNLGAFLSEIPAACRAFFNYFFRSAYFTKFYQTVQILFLTVALGAFLYLVISQRFYREKGRLTLSLIGLGLLPLALNFITVLSVGAWVHALMIYSFVLFDVFALKMVELAVRRLIVRGRAGWVSLRTVAAVMAGLLIWNNFCISNMAYLRLQVCYENSYALANRIAARIELLDGYSPELPVAIVGEASRKLYGGTVKEFSQINSLTGTSDYLLYSPEPHIRTRTFIEDYIGLHMPKPTAEQKKRLADSEKVKSMPIYPAEGSVILYENMVVVKLSDGVVR